MRGVLDGGACSGSTPPLAAGTLERGLGIGWGEWIVSVRDLNVGIVVWWWVVLLDGGIEMVEMDFVCRRLITVYYLSWKEQRVVIKVENNAPAKDSS
jgi:hypothetical protein